MRFTGVPNGTEALDADNVTDEGVAPPEGIFELMYAVDEQPEVAAHRSRPDGVTVTVLARLPVALVSRVAHARISTPAPMFKEHAVDILP